LVNNKEVAATAVTGADIDIAAMPRNNSIDLNTGRPLAAMAATAMEVSVDALLSGPGAEGGGGTQILDQSTLNAAYARQGNWVDFFTRVLRVMGVPEPSVTFNNIIVDPAYRNVQSLSQAWMTGLFSADVMQAAYAEQLGIEAPAQYPMACSFPTTTEASRQAVARSVQATRTTWLAPKEILALRLTIYLTVTTAIGTYKTIRDR
jgi:hypothetical protein